MYGPPGIAYVYLVYGMHDCLNVVTEPVGRPAAVLIRAVEAVDRVAADAMRAARQDRWLRRQHASDEPEAPAAPEASAIAREEHRLAALPDVGVASGPGLVAAAFGLTRADTGADLLDPTARVRLLVGSPPARILSTPRIGIAYAAEPWRSHPWRFIDADSRAVSGGASSSTSGSATGSPARGSAS